MGYTRRVYPVVEVALSCQSMASLASGHERKQEGDIIEVRRPEGAIGFMEVSRFLWLRLTGLEEADIDRINKPAEGYEKRRYRIPLERLAQVVPGFDPARARDATDVYQPFLGVDEDTAQFVWTSAPLDATDLILDTQTREYR